MATSLPTRYFNSTITGRGGTTLQPVTYGQAIFIANPVQASAQQVDQLFVQDTELCSALYISGTPRLTRNIQTDPNCCGVRHIAQMSEDFNYTAESATAQIRAKLDFRLKSIYLDGTEKFKSRYPTDYDHFYKGWEGNIVELCTTLLKNYNVATIIMHFMRPQGCKGYVAGILRDVIKAWPGSVNMGEYVNPNTKNIINGFCIPTMFDSRLDKE